MNLGETLMLLGPGNFKANTNCFMPAKIVFK